MRASLLAACLLLVIVDSSSAFADENRKLDTIRWILGDWTRSTDKVNTNESWTDTGDGVFTGRETDTSSGDDKLRSRESLLLVEMDGEVFYIAQVRQNAFPVPFKLVVSSSTHAVFENKEHDFFKRLEYRFGEDGNMITK